MSRFRTTQLDGSKGFQLTLANGWTVSVQFHQVYYDERYHVGDSSEKVTDVFAPAAEVAAWYGGVARSGNWITVHPMETSWYDFGTDTVKGGLSSNEAVEFMSMVKTLPARPLYWRDYTRAKHKKFHTPSR